MRMSLKISHNFLILHPVLKRQHLRCFSYSILWNTVYQPFFMVSVCVFLTPCVSYLCMHVPLIIWFINFQMTTWSFRDTLVELEVRGHFDKSVLWSMQGLHMGDIHFAEIQTTFKMRVVPFHMFLQFFEKGSFNVDNLPADGYSHTTAILLAFVPNPRLADIEHMGIGNVIRRHGTPLGDIASIHVVIDQITGVILAIERKKDSARRRAYMMLIGNYGGHMAFATWTLHIVLPMPQTTRTLMILWKWHPVNP